VAADDSARSQQDHVFSYASNFILVLRPVSGDEARDAEASDDGKRRSKKHKKHHKKEKKEKDRSSRREHEASPVAPPQLYSQDRRHAALYKRTL